MLAQSFQSATDLEISEMQKDALVKTLKLLETDAVEHSTAFDFDRCDHEHTRQAFSGQFNMRYWAESGECGTIACIGGTAELITGVRFGLTWVGNDRLANLFQPQTLPLETWSAITTEQAARALRSYLTTGDAKWAEAVSA